jgi:hypothetical protein
VVTRVTRLRGENLRPVYVVHFGRTRSRLRGVSRRLDTVRELEVGHRYGLGRKSCAWSAASAGGIPSYMGSSVGVSGFENGAIRVAF